MPAFTRTPADEARWSKAKEAANKQHSESEGDRYWGLVNHIYQNMKKGDLVKSIRDLVENNKDVLLPEQLDKVLNTLLKARGDEDDEENEGHDQQDYGMDEDELPSHMRITDDPFEDDDSEGAKWLKEHGDEDSDEAGAAAPEIGGQEADETEEAPEEVGTKNFFDWKHADAAEKLNHEKAKQYAHSLVDAQPNARDHNIDKARDMIDNSASSKDLANAMRAFTASHKSAQEEVKGKSGYSEWKPQAQYKPEHQKKMNDLMSQGYSHREAERIAGASQSPKDFQSALTHTVKPSQPSPKMLEELKGLAGHWLDRADRHAKVNADPEKNPQKFAAGKMMQAHEEHAKDFNKDYDAFLNSDKAKGLKGLERHKAIQAWKNEWKQKNPEYSEGAGNVSDAQKHYKEASGVRQKSLDEAIQHIMTGGQSGDTMSYQEAAQHVGGSKGDEGYSATTIKDPSASFAENNPEYVNRKRQQQEAGAPQPVQKPKSDAMTVIRRRANPEQMDRFTRVQAARAAQGVGKKPEGIE